MSVARYSKATRQGKTEGLGALASSLRNTIYAHADDAGRARFRAAERRQQVYAAWNQVCGGTREGQHVTGLYFVPDANELVVYTDGAAWTQELTMLREIIRARMETAGAAVDALVIKTSREGHRRTAPVPVGAARAAAQKAAPPHAALNEAEQAQVARACDGVDDAKLKQALIRAMTASLEWKKGRDN